MRVFLLGKKFTSLLYKANSVLCSPLHFINKWCFVLILNLVLYFTKYYIQYLNTVAYLKKAEKLKKCIYECSSVI